jgi:outer membrane protein OmpA-like peptidoglycan-associated protein
MSTLYALYINGVLVESSTSTTLTYTFDKRQIIQASTVSCSVTISQEDVTSEYKSIDNLLFKSIQKVRNDAFESARNSYQIARDAAYALRVESDGKSVAVWKKSLDLALAKRNAAEDAATAMYIKALEKEAISIFHPAPIAKKTDAQIVIKQPEKVNVQPTKEMKKIGTIYFATGTYFINDASKKLIKELALVIAKSDPSTLLSYGHTDNKGGTNNLLLSQNRAKAVARLIHSLLPNQKIKTGWYAASKPISSGSSKADLAKNRRVEIYAK